MPSMQHEGLVLLLREQPEVIRALLTTALGVTVPRRGAIRIEDTHFTQLVPAAYDADLVLTIRHRGRVRLGVVVEVQLRPDPRKRYSWPLYAAALHARLRCEVVLLVVTPLASVAAWARRPVTTLQRHGPFVPLVLGPDEIPRIARVALARRLPELAVLSSLAHGNEPDGHRVVKAALAAAARLDRKRGLLYDDLILSALNDAARRALEENVDLSRYRFQSEFVRKHYGEGHAKGVAEGKAEAVLAVLAARQLAVSARQRTRVLACKDTEQLDAWLLRAMTASSAREALAVVREPPKSAPARRPRTRVQAPRARPARATKKT
jgi:hypothetical protein